MAAKKFPIHPAHPERTCWGCDKYCPSDNMACGNGSDRTQHPVELFGEDWAQEGLDPYRPALPVIPIVPVAVNVPAETANDADMPAPRRETGAC